MGTSLRSAMHAAVRHLLGFEPETLERPVSRPPRPSPTREAAVPVYQDLGAGAESERVQRALYRISEAAHASPTLQALFSELHAIVGDLMPARNFYIALHDPATDTLSFPYFVDEKDPPPAPRRLRKGLTEYVLRSGQALLDRPGVYADLVTRGEVESIGAASSDWLGVPLKTGDRTIGVLTAQSYDEGVRYTERDRDILQFVSTQVAMAIERKRGEEALRASEGELRAVFSAMRDVILVLDATGRYRKVAPTNPGLLYKSADVLLGRTLHDVFPPRQADEFLRHITRALHTGEVVHADYALTIEDRRVWFTATVSPMTYDSVVWVARDITEQKLALEALAESESRYRALYNRSPVMAHSIDLEGRIVAVSDFWLATLGYQRDEVLGRPVTDFLTPESARMARETVLQALMRDGSCTDVEHQMVTSSGQVLDVLLSAISEKDGEGKATQSLAILTDVTERKRIARELQHSQERVEQFVQTTNDVLWDWELERQEIWWAPTLRNLVGFQPHEFQGDSWTRALHPEDRERIWAGLREAISGTGRLWSAEYRMRKRDGEYCHLLDRATILRDANGRAVRMVGAMMDVSERKEAEAALRHSEDQLRQAMKMEAVGRLAGGVAHDFNNLLTAVLGHADLALTQADPGNPFHDDLQEIKQAALRAAALTQQLLAFSRKQVLERRVVDLNQIVAGITRMLDRTIGEDIELVTDLAPELGRVHADAIQLEQVLLNLAVNARDAMPEGGRLTIETMNVQSEAGAVVRIRVADTGVGMTPEVLAHIFEPFFTTKELGKGTGLGLATVYGIVKQSGGHISVSSSRGHGTTFLIDFPRSPDEPRIDVVVPSVERRSGGTETILLVEDEATVRTLARRVLEQRGYKVLEAQHPEQALIVSRGFQEQIDLLLTDVVMPGMSGIKLAEQLTAERRSMSVVYMSGYAATSVEQRLLLDDSVPFIQKPFTPDILARRVREVLDEAARRVGIATAKVRRS
ncbi:MAG TPA: PAS domain S-box protein [Gemmatimonadales bacterium]|nr:PAS domain S-box protein [Gemmatimonadales bacterium]